MGDKDACEQGTSEMSRRPARGLVTSMSEIMSIE